MAPGTGLSPELRSAIEQFITENKVVAFIKGTKQFPQCGFSNTVVQVRSRGPGRVGACALALPALLPGVGATLTSTPPRLPIHPAMCGADPELHERAVRHRQRAGG